MSVAPAPVIAPEMLLAVPELLIEMPVVVAMAAAVTLIAFTVRVERGEVPPTFPVKVTRPDPLASTISEAGLGLFTVLANVTFAVASVVFVPRFTGPL